MLKSKYQINANFHNIKLFFIRALTIDISILSASLQFQYCLEGTEGHLDLGFRGFTSGHPLEPKPRLDEILNALGSLAFDRQIG